MDCVPSQLPVSVQERLREFQTAIYNLEAQRRQYIRGALDALGLTGDYEINLQSGEWRRRGEASAGD